MHKTHNVRPNSCIGSKCSMNQNVFSCVIPHWDRNTVRPEVTHYREKVQTGLFLANFLNGRTILSDNKNEVI